MFGSFVKNKRGFSLVELMVVVAIIGILASIAIPSINKYMAKARQSEAKTNLSSLYTGEKAFYAEYNTYDSRFAAVGFTPEGQLRYNVGFSGVGVQAGVANGYNTPPANVAYQALGAAGVGYCGAGNGAFLNGCAVLNGASGAAPAAIADAICTVSTSGVAAACTTRVADFQAGATSVIQSGAAADSWAIDSSKVLRNTANGIQ
jgi:type IV pilus assembly protein PilA